MKQNEKHLRFGLIRLAYSNKHLRPWILPLLGIRKAMEMTEREWETYHDKHPNAKKTDHTIVNPPSKQQEKKWIAANPPENHEKDGKFHTVVWNPGTRGYNISDIADTKEEAAKNLANQMKNHKKRLEETDA